MLFPNVQLTNPSVRRAFQSVVTKVDQYFTEWKIPKSDPLVVGLSGGKDSLLATLVLRELNINIKPAIVDLGYENFEADAIRAYAHTLGISAECIRGRTGPVYEQLTVRSQEKHKIDLNFLENPGDQTPCGSCSMSKRRLLQGYANMVKARFIVLAHHRTDAIVTILKDYFLNEYHKCWTVFERDRFKEFLTSHTFELAVLRDLVSKSKAATMGFRVKIPDSNVEVIRPLIYVDEQTIAYVVSEAGIRPFGSGCSHSFFLTKDDSRATKRELVHAAVIQKYSEHPNLMADIFDIAKHTVDEQGYQLFNPRQERGK